MLVQALPWPLGVDAEFTHGFSWLEGQQSPASHLKAFHVVLAEFQGHHGWKALAILRMASLRFFAVQASTTPASALAGSPKYITRSLKTSNEQTAVDLGRRLLFQIEQRADQGLPPKSKLFAAVIDDYIRYRERDHRHGGTSAGMLRQIIRVSKFWREYAGELAVEAIDDKVMREFIPWRRDYYAAFKKLPKNAKRHPADKNHQWDMMLGKAIVRWAQSKSFVAISLPSL